jgi:hypothetical protein
VTAVAVLDPLDQALHELYALDAVDWDAAKDRMVEAWFHKKGVLYAAEPRAVSPIPAGTDIRAAVIGSKMLGLALTPQGCIFAGVLEAKTDQGLPLYDDVTGEIPRRATKTTTVQNVLLGRCVTRPGYRVIQTAQDGTRASIVFMDMVRTLERVTPNEEERGWTVFKSTGREYIQFDNGSRWWVAPPKSSSFRGLAADVIWFDECGELDPVESDDLEAGALPVMDTREDAQVIKTGTPGLVRAGMFWKSLEAAEADPKALGVLRFAARDSEVVDIEGLVERGETSAIEALLLRVHPGLACGLTSMAKMLKRLATMDLAKFIREYLCVWPPDTSATALNLAKWANTETAPAPAPVGTPWAIGYNVGIGGVAGAIVAGWFDQNGEPHLQVMEYRVKSDWMVEELARAGKAHPRVPVGYDNIGENISVAQALGRKPRYNAKVLQALQLRQVAAATATVALHTDLETIHHGTSPALDKAVGAATWRESGGSRLFRRIEGADISVLLAGVHALAAAATLKRRTGGTGYAPITD